MSKLKNHQNQHKQAFVVCALLYPSSLLPLLFPLVPPSLCFARQSLPTIHPTPTPHLILQVLEGQGATNAEPVRKRKEKKSGGSFKATTTRELPMGEARSKLEFDMSGGSKKRNRD